MSKILLSFRLYEPDPGISSLGISALTRQEKYDALIEYLQSISYDDTVVEDNTTSLIFSILLKKVLIQYQLK